MSAFSKEASYIEPALVYFRKRLNVEVINKINDAYLKIVDHISEYDGENESEHA